ncbi:MAG: NYN domain-containing protein [Candidatus Kerfeldbacteria bacterium]
MLTERIQIYLDGGNFYHLVLKKMGIKDLDFDYEAFSVLIGHGRQIVPQGKRFYQGSVREKLGDSYSVRAMSKQTALFTGLQSTHWEVKTSKLRTRRERIKIDKNVEDYQNILKKGIQEIIIERVREKGIDVKLATDLIVGAVDDKYDIGIVVSSDTDLIPAIDWVGKRKHKKIEYVGFSVPDNSPLQEHTRPLPTMIVHSDIQRTFTDTDLRPFIKPQAQVIPLA